jgi:hypothetical protein
MLGQQLNAVALNNGCGFNAILVIGETLFWHEASHANVNTRLVGISIGVGSPDLTQLANRRIQKHDVNVVMMRIGAGRAQLSKRAALQPSNLARRGNRKGALGGPCFQNAAPYSTEHSCSKPYPSWGVKKCQHRQVSIRGRARMRAMLATGCTAVSWNKRVTKSGARVELRLPRQLLPKLALGFTDLRGHLDLSDDNQVTATSPTLGQTAPANTQFLA